MIDIQPLLRICWLLWSSHRPFATQQARRVEFADTRGETVVRANVDPARDLNTYLISGFSDIYCHRE